MVNRVNIVLSAACMQAVRYSIEDSRGSWIHTGAKLVFLKQLGTFILLPGSLEHCVSWSTGVTCLETVEASSEVWQAVV